MPARYLQTRGTYPNLTDQEKDPLMISVGFRSVLIGLGSAKCLKHVLKYALMFC